MDHTPDVILGKCFDFNHANVREWYLNDPVWNFLGHTLLEDAMKGWFDIKEEGEEEVWEEWETHKKKLEELDFFTNVLKCCENAWNYRLGMMKETDVAKKNGRLKWQVVNSWIIQDESMVWNEFGEPVECKIKIDEGEKTLHCEDFYCIYLDHYKFRPIFSYLIYHAYLQFFTLEAAAREGGKFLWVWTKLADETLFNKAHAQLYGANSRRILMTSTQHFDPEHTQYVDTKNTQFACSELFRVYWYSSW